MKYLALLFSLSISFSVLLCFPSLSFAEDKIELDTTVIKGNSELPKILYVVPWQDISENKQATQKLTLHSLFGDLFEPYVPPAPENIASGKE